MLKYSLLLIILLGLDASIAQDGMYLVQFAKFS